MSLKVRFGLVRRRLAQLIELLLGGPPIDSGAVLHLVEMRLEVRKEVLAELRGVRGKLGELPAQNVEVALKIGPFLVTLVWLA